MGSFLVASNTVTISQYLGQKGEKGSPGGLLGSPQGEHVITNPLHKIERSSENVRCLTGIQGFKHNTTVRLSLPTWQEQKAALESRDPQD